MASKETLIVIGLALAAGVFGQDHRAGDWDEGWVVSDPEPDPEVPQTPKPRTLKDKEQPRLTFPPVDESRDTLKKTLRIMKGDLDKLRHQLEGEAR